MSNPFISISLYGRPPEQIDARYINNGGGYGMMSQMGDLDNYGLEGVRTLIESKPGYGFYVFLIKKTPKFKKSLKEYGLLQTYEVVQAMNSGFKSYMMSQLGYSGDNYMICVAQDDWTKLPSGQELLSSELVEALKHISYGVSRGGKRVKKSYKKKSNKKSRKSRKTRRYKK
jgi:hypothetical protein